MRLTLRHIVKRYAAVVANDGVNLDVRPGEIHAVLGENGAGKSTLMKIIYGAVRPDAGEMIWNGNVVQVSDPAAARRLGIAMVYQHFSLFDTLTVAENIALGLPATTKLDQLAARITDTASQYGLELEPQRHVHTLSVGERQRVEIVRALLTRPQLLILDEPTSVLTPQAVGKLFGTLRQLAAEGCSILYISHKLDEIRALCHTCTVMRAGKVTGVCDPREETEASLSRMMIGADLPHVSAGQSAPGKVMLAVDRLDLPRSHPFGVELRGVSFEVHAGEILGVAGISGNGQQELLAALSGEDTRAAPGSVALDGQPVGHLNAARRRQLGMGFIPEERLGRGTVPEMSLAANVLLSHQGPPTISRGLIRQKAITDLAAAVIERFQVKASGPLAQARSLSGGNLQKFIVGREVVRQPRVLLVAQPTWGVDVGASARIRAELIALRDAGCALLVISEELSELFEISDRLMVIAKGRVRPPIPVSQASVAQIGLWMSGLETGEPANAGTGTDIVADAGTIIATRATANPAAPVENLR